MKDLFPGHYLPTAHSVESIWNDGLFVFDASVLLNLYRYSDATREDLLTSVGKQGQRLWIPHQVAEEFQRNRPSVIMQLADTYAEASQHLEKVEADLIAKFTSAKHPFVEASLLEKLKSVLKEFHADLDKRRSQRDAVLWNDAIQERLAGIFHGRVGKPYEESELAPIIVNAKERFAKKQPPGFKDCGEKADGREFGDVILWRQVLDHAKATQTHVIFVTDDMKEDWWWTIRKKRIAARPELIAEFRAVTGRELLMLDSVAFLEEARERLKQPLKAASLQEVRRVRRRSKPKRRRPRLEERPVPVQLEVLRRKEAELVRMLSVPGVDKLGMRDARTWPGLLLFGSKQVLEGMLASTREQINGLTKQLASSAVPTDVMEQHPAVTTAS